MNEVSFSSRLSFEEFMGEESRAERLFKLMDKDGDGYVTKNVRFCLKWSFKNKLYFLVVCDSSKIAISPHWPNLKNLDFSYNVLEKGFGLKKLKPDFLGAAWKSKVEKISILPYLNTFRRDKGLK